MTAAVSYVFFWHFAREIGAWLAQIWSACACLSFDRCGHWGSVFKHYNFCEANTQMHANVCNLFKFKITFSQLSKRWKISHKLSLTGSQTKTRTKIYGYTFSDKDKQLVGTTDQKIEYLKIALHIEEQGCRWGLLLRWFILNLTPYSLTIR